MISTSASIGHGVTLGTGCVRAARSMVKRSMPSNYLIAENPERAIKELKS
jgi:acetyltransferase-like isoleucine patch superfamily enzyme